MSPSSLSLSSLAASTGAAAFLFISTLLGAGDLRAQGYFIEPALGAKDMGLPLVRPRLDPADEIAALEAVEIALTQAGDGATYVWQRDNGRLGGAIRVTSTFRDTDGRMCRHLEMQLRQGDYARKTEGIACRDTDGVWLLEG